ncbi:MAG: glutamine amidotransferase [Herbinix sp.]|jgi:5'-phosphate synthase pdxT subunit|nr:glutamine amidotransferase [Herbinix sp.]
MNKRIGVLALQGAFAEHMAALNKIGADCFEIRQKSDLTLQTPDGIILPGGESTVIGKLLQELDMLGDLKKLIEKGLPVFGTCAGMILLAGKLSNDDHKYLGTMDITVKRNAYGRQLGSFQTMGLFKGIGDLGMTFIRAPYIETLSEDKGVEALAVVNDRIVAARQGNMLVTSFHPELSEDLRVHEYFIQMLT